jgi:hypothetical protein
MLKFLYVYICRVFVSTWNVGGKSPNRNLNIDDWLHSSPPADIYVLGFVHILKFYFCLLLYGSINYFFLQLCLSVFRILKLTKPSSLYFSCEKRKM